MEPMKWIPFLGTPTRSIYSISIPWSHISPSWYLICCMFSHWNDCCNYSRWNFVSIKWWPRISSHAEVPRGLPHKSWPIWIELSPCMRHTLLVVWNLSCILILYGLHEVEHERILIVVLHKMWAGTLFKISPLIIPKRWCLEWGENVFPGFHKFKALSKSWNMLILSFEVEA